jgi:hypothetical protein
MKKLYKFENFINEQVKQTDDDKILTLPEVNIQGRKFNKERNPEFDNIEYSTQNTLADLPSTIKPFEEGGELYKSIIFQPTKMNKGMKAIVTSYKNRLRIFVFKKDDKDLGTQIESILKNSGLSNIYPSEGTNYIIIGGNYKDSRQAIKALATLSDTFDFNTCEMK